MDQASDVPTLRDVVVALLDSAGGRIEGKTILQKLAYFLSTQLRTDFGYTPYFYGPFSRPLETAIELLLLSGAVEETTTTLGRNTEGWDIRQSTYSLTDVGKAESEEASQRHPELAQMAS